METRQQQLIRRALENAEGSDKAGGTPRGTSLQEQALEHTDPHYVPRTLTPHEWELYYREHGVPAEHRRRPESSARGESRARRFLRGLFPRAVKLKA
jgi:hypothetical protein